jgi:hypothetical protein
MKHLLLLLLLCPALAKAECHVFQLKGKAKFADKKIQLIVRQGTASERSFSLRPGEQEGKLLPYMRTAFEGEFVLRGDDPATGAVVEEVLSVDHAVLDPLDRSGEMKKLRAIDCPK